MKTLLMIFTLFGILITSIGVSPAFGENESITVTTDKLSYSESETISISGEIEYLALGNVITIMVISPNGNIAEIAQMKVSSDKQFSKEINTIGPYWKISGTYTILITQDKNNQATLSFEFGGVESVPVNELEESVLEESVPEDVIITDSVITTTTITVQDSTDLILYEITNAEITNVIPDLENVSLLINIKTTDDGSITLTIPKSVLDAKITDGDGEFYVLVDNEEVYFEEITTSTDRTLTIEFLAGSEQIEIIGTFVIPEFGTIAAMILAVAIISIITISAKSRLSIPSRY